MLLASLIPQLLQLTADATARLAAFARLRRWNIGIARVMERSRHKYYVSLCLYASSKEQTQQQGAQRVRILIKIEHSGCREGGYAPSVVLEQYVLTE